MSTLNNNIDVAKKLTLENFAVSLKERFVGLDGVIDEMMPLVSAWWLFPQAQQRPSVINLWGLTGSGKTALVNAIVDLLDLRSRYAYFDMGDHEWKPIKEVIVNNLKTLHEQQVIICLDEFQFA